MAELRYNPLLDDWVMIASSRQNRPQMPENYCPFCPGSGKVPAAGYTVLRYPNDFPALSVDPPAPDDVATPFFKAAPAYGRCEVILYSLDHNKTVSMLSDAAMRELAALWRDVYRDMAADEKIKYCMIFENRGAAVGVTMPHPHGQAYGYSVMPKKLTLEIENSRNYYRENGRCLFCDMLENELAFAKRVIFRSEYFTVFLPFFSEYPFGVYVLSNRHVTDIACMSDSERDDLGLTVKKTAGMYDSLYGYTFPYMMCMHNAPVNSGDFDETWHFHIEFYPVMRSRDKQKFNASSETGAWAHCNPTCPEEKAAELREAYERYIGSCPD